eukprot:347371-Pleurochrysis_carterae.AAC.2
MEGYRVQDRESHPTLYPGEVVGAPDTEGVIRIRGRNMTRLTERARNNKHKHERKGETHTEKRTRPAKGREGTRLVSVKPVMKDGGGEWEEPARREDTTARKLLGWHDGKGKHTVFKDDSMDLVHVEEYAGHPILRLFTRPEENEQGVHRLITTEDARHMNGDDGKKLTFEALEVALSLHEKYDFHIAAATDGAKKGGTKDRTESLRISDTTYGAWQDPESARILRGKKREAAALQNRLGVQLNQADKLLAIEQGILSGRLGDSATSAEAELLAIFAILRKVQALQETGHYGGDQAKVLIMSDSLSGIETLEKVWRGKRMFTEK